MNYEIVNLEEKKVVGLTAKTTNNDPQMTNIIGDLWKRFYGEGIYANINNKINNKALGIYSDYESDVNGKYSVTVACEVSNFDILPKGAIEKIIPAGKYAKFVVKGNMVTAVADFWQKLWNMNLDRKYENDFEEYQNSYENNAVIHMYISLK